MGFIGGNFYSVCNMDEKYFGVKFESSTWSIINKESEDFAKEIKPPQGLKNPSDLLNWWSSFKDTIKINLRDTASDVQSKIDKNINL